MQTLLKPEEMDRKLRGLHSYIRTSIEETGVNTLYAAFGFLEWYEAPSSNKPHHAPLLLLQLEIEKKQRKSGFVYEIQSTEEELKKNLSINEHLKTNFGLELPDLDEEETPESYFVKMANLIQDAPLLKQKKWRIRRFITFGHFRFARLFMYHDLNEARRQNGTLSTHPILQNLLVGKENASAASFAEDYRIDTPQVEAAVPLLITSADASQHSTLVDVMNNKNLAIEGPPGTGKSQTITNIIANALAKGKTVLFLAEKKAALEVVHKRLSDAKLGPYCLEMHSTKAKKAELIKSLKERLETPPKTSRGNLETKLQDFKRHRDHITEYVRVLNTEFGRQNKTIHDHLWTYRLQEEALQNALGDLFFKLEQTTLPFAQADLTESEITKHTDKLKEIIELKKTVNQELQEGKHPWHFIPVHSRLDLFAQSSLQNFMRSWKGQLENIQEILQDFSDRFLLQIEGSATGLNTFLNKTKRLTHWNPTDLELIHHAINKLDENQILQLHQPKIAQAFSTFVQNIGIYKAETTSIVTLNDVSQALAQITEIEKQVKLAKALEVDGLSALEVHFKIKELEEFKELEEKSPFWEEWVKTMSEKGKLFGLSGHEGLDKFYDILEIPDYIATLPQNCLHFRTKEPLDETERKLLKKAIETQVQTQDFMEEQSKHFHLSRMGQPNEMLADAKLLGKAGLFAFFNSAYHQAKKRYLSASKEKSKSFDAKQAAKTLYEIASTQQKRQDLEQDKLLQLICEPFFEGLNTDFEKIHQINEWADTVQKRYVARDQSTRNVRQWLFTAKREELDAFREFAQDDKWIALKHKIEAIQQEVSSDTPVRKYLVSIEEKIKKLQTIHTMLQTFAVAESSTFGGIATDLPHLQKANQAKTAVETEETAKAFFGENYAGVDTHMQGMEQIARLIQDCQAFSEVKHNLEIFLNKDFKTIWQAFIENRATLQKQQEDIQKQAVAIETLSALQLPAGRWENMTYSALAECFIHAVNQPDSLSTWIDLNARLTQADQDLKGTVLNLYNQEKLDFETLPLAFEYMIQKTLVQEIYTRNPTILSTKGFTLEQARTRFKTLDEEIVRLHQEALSQKLHQSHPLSGNGQGKKSTWTEGPLLHNEINKQKAHIPMRKLMQRAGCSIQKIKPCFLMSPMTVAQYLTPGKLNFDLLIIDEASQMRTEDALGAAVRAKRIVVVGDPKQLPPTSFFESKKNEDEDEEDMLEEAIMDRALNFFRPPRRLKNHYRSRHESLIAFSNRHFYDDALVLFPSPGKNPDAQGIRLVEVGGTYASRSNMEEVKAVIEAVLEFMRKHRNHSLGVVAMNGEQKQLLEDEMDRVFSENLHAREYRETWQNTLEPFFVKNLESVQGDERDAIFISTVYGPDKNGVVKQNFGPINRANGHRRLNVLFTRAKKNMVIFTSLKPNDIRIAEHSSQGMRALKGFLSYASTGVLDNGEQTHQEPDSDFEIFVKEKLESIGCEVHPQVGVGRYRIDLGIKHPNYPYGYLMGVECDGATYHSSKSARERDVIRQEVLEGLGWKIYRIWSTDWFSNPSKEFEKLKDAIEKQLSQEKAAENEPEPLVPQAPPPEKTPDSENFSMKAEAQAPAETLVPQAPPPEKTPDSKNFSMKAEENETETLVPQTPSPEKITDGEKVIQLYDQVTYRQIEEDGKTKEFTTKISVGKDTFEEEKVASGKTISSSSSIGKALLGCQEGEEVETKLPSGKEIRLEVLKIEKP